MRKFMKLSNALLERNLVPDPLIRFGIRRLLKEKLDEETGRKRTEGNRRKQQFVQVLASSPIAVNTLQANEQHYEVPTEFFRLVMGRHMKYSCGLWNEGVRILDQSEEDMLDLTIRRAEISDRQRILELGCGWGSLLLRMAEKFPGSRITGVSNSRTQREYILSQAGRRNLTNVDVITADMNEFTIDEKFDRIVSVEMLEHMRNYRKLFARIAGFLKADGKFFVHIFTHREFAYLYEQETEHDWIGRYFFTGGIMPSQDLFSFFQDDLKIEEQWQVSGRHYQKTSEAWLANVDRNRNKIIPILKQTYGEDQYKKWWVYWRVFFMSCAELWGYRSGQEWGVTHYRFIKAGKGS